MAFLLIFEVPPAVDHRWFVRTTEDRAVAACHSVDPAGWRVILDEAVASVAGQFVRAEPRRTAGQFVEGLLSGLERKTCWSLAERAGHDDPQAMQRLLRTAVWDADGVRDDVRAWLIGQLGHPDAVLVTDETGFLKKGVCSVGTQRQYTGTAGRVENSQVGVFLAYVSPAGRALIDRRLYLPETTWCARPERLTAAGVPDQVGFATKPALARQMITAAIEAGVPFGWVTGDEVYGADPGLRGDLEHRRIGYVLAVGCDRRVHVNDGRTLVRVDEVADRIPHREWQPHSCGPGAKGHRDYMWAWIITATRPGEHRWLLIRRNRTTGVLAFYLWLVTPPGAVAHPRQGRRLTVEHRRVVPDRQGPGRPGPLPGPRLDRLAPPRHPGHARPGRSDHPRRPATRHRPRDHRVDRRRDPPAP
jgi:hypothetical protein